MIYSLVYSPVRYWLVGALSTGRITVFDLELKEEIISIYYQEICKTSAICTTLHFTPDGQILFTGMSDGKIYSWPLKE
jgi:WD40 repeat protein